MAANLVSNFKAYGGITGTGAGTGRVAIQWKNPDAGTYTGIKILLKASSMPTSYTDADVIIDLTGTALSNTTLTYSDEQIAYFAAEEITPPDALYVKTGLARNTSYGVAIYSYSGETNGTLVVDTALRVTNAVPSFNISSIAFTSEDYSTIAPDGYKITVTNTANGRTIENPLSTLPYGLDPSELAQEGRFSLTSVDTTDSYDVVFPGDVLRFSLYNATDTLVYESNYKITFNEVDNGNLAGYWETITPPVWSGFAMVHPPAPINQLPPPPTVTAGDNPATTADITPICIWNASLDPEGGPVNYAIEFDSVETFDSGIDHKLFKSVDAASVAQFQYDLNGTGNWAAFNANLLGVVGNSNTKIRFEVPASSFLTEKRWYWRVYATDNQLQP